MINQTLSQHLPTYKLFVSGVSQEHMFYIRNDNKIFGCGSNSENQLGIITKKQNILVPQSRLSGYKAVKKICTGNSHTIIFTNNNKLFAFGMNSSGECCVGMDIKSIDTPTEIIFLKESIDDVIVGSNHNVFLLKDSIWSGGEGKRGELGHGFAQSSNVPVKVKFHRSQIKSVKLGGFYSIFLTKLGDIYSTGDIYTIGIEGVLVPTKISKITERVIKIFPGFYHFFAVTNCGKFYGVGDVSKTCFNNEIQETFEFNHLLYENKTMQNWERSKDIIDIKCGDWHSLFLMRNGDVYGIGDLQNYGCENVKYNVNHEWKMCKLPVKNIVQIETSCSASYMIDHEGKLFVAGSNHDGNLGLNHREKINHITYNVYVKNIQKIKYLNNSLKWGLLLWKMLLKLRYIDVIIT